MIRNREPIKDKSFFDKLISDTSFPEKLIVILWCMFPYFLYIMLDFLTVWWYRILGTVGVWVILSLFCYWFGVFMSSEDRDWNY